jgi:HK97 gp10 family phage protein
MIVAELRPRVSAAVKESAEEIEGMAKERVAVDSGDLRDAIHTERRGPAEYAVVAGGEGVFYGHMVEHGTTKMPARPFLVPAAEVGRLPAAARVTAVLRSL